ncbi:MAG: YggS family pyridoxal phosphate-dependent enzyme, partial [Acutalibacteraceae bacterium]
KAHLIGHLQSNKVKKIVGKVETIQSVDSVSIATEIGKRSVEAGVTTKILLEINAGNEESKFGFSRDEVFEKACEISEIKGILIDGLMCVAPICEKEAEIRTIFSNIHRLFIDIASKKRDNINMNVLSMGMSGDYKQAILEGSNLVRIGSAIFGGRIYR